MREILFKGKRIDNDEWVEGFLVKKIDPLLGVESWFILVQEYDTSCIDGKPTLLESLMTWYKVIPETVSEFTGLCDKNGKKIFEGDIITMPAYHGGRHKSVVYFKNGKFAVDGSNYGFKDIAPRSMEIIGNIHDNPELLRKEDEGK